MHSTQQLAPALLQRVLSVAQDGVFVYQIIRNASGVLTDLRLTMVNAVAEQDMGQPANELLWQSFSSLFSELVQTELMAQFRPVIETGRGAHFTTRISWPGTNRLAWLDMTVVRVDGYLLASYVDMTQRRADAEAARLKAVLQQAFDVDNKGISVLDVVRDTDGRICDFRFTLINEAGLRMSGFSREELLGRTLWQLYPATGINGMFHQYVAVYETNQPYAGEHYYPEYDCWRDITVVPVDGGILVRYADSTVRRKLRDIIQQPGIQVQDVLLRVPAGVAVLQPIRSSSDLSSRIVDFRIDQANARLANWLGRPDLVGQLLTNVVATARESGFLCRCTAGYERAEPQTFTTPFDIVGAVQVCQVSIARLGTQLVLAIQDTVRTSRGVAQQV